MAAYNLGALVFLLLVLLCAGQREVNIKTPYFRVNGTVGHSAWLLVEIDPIPKDAEITWKFNVKPRSTSIARFDISQNNLKIFPHTEFEGRITLHQNLTLQINNLRITDGGTYTVSVTAGQDYTGEISLQVYEPVSVPTVELIQNVTAERCNVTVLCSVSSGSHINYTWTWLGSNRTDGPVEHVSGNPGELEVSVGRSHSIHYRCTVWNPVSKESAELRIETPCTKSQEGSSSLENGNIILIIVISIILFCLLVILAIVIYWKLLHKLGSGNMEESMVFDHHLTRVPTVPNNYENNTSPESPCTVYAVVQRTDRT
ncbi:SLAM family member 8-like [Rhincodon typus]|uniref:SLAM family member 8-like n=1 Tax=Rhincodon typus TaxID=259920 RepID=UPI00202F7B04|nr:SLAM family member 8-like [Rhincodon typus]